MYEVTLAPSRAQMIACRTAQLLVVVSIFENTERRTLMNRDWVTLLLTAITWIFDLLQQNA